MDASGILAVTLVVGAVVLAAVLFFTGRLGRRRHEMTRAGLSRRASEAAESLRAFVDEREASRPEDDTVIKDHELPSHRVMLHDEETREMYLREWLPEISELRKQIHDHGVRDRTFDSLYESAENGSDLRTVSTALSEMARSLHPRE